MKSFVEWLTARQYRMVLLTAAMLLPPLGLFGLAIIGQAVIILAVLLFGFRIAAMIAAIATALMVVPALLVGANGATMLVIALVNLLPAIGLAVVLERSRSLSLTTQVATIAVVAAVVLFFIAGSPAATWQAFFDRNLLLMGDQAPELPTGFVGYLSQIMTGLFGAVTLLTSMVAVFIARWWQAILRNPGGFGVEFKSLRMGVVIGLLAGFVFIAAGLTKIVLLENLTLVLVTSFMLHGLAVLHAIAATGGSFWLIAVYGLMIVATPFAQLAVAGLGFLDNWFDLRSRLVRR